MKRLSTIHNRLLHRSLLAPSPTSYYIMPRRGSSCSLLQPAITYGVAGALGVVAYYWNNSGNSSSSSNQRSDLSTAAAPKNDCIYLDYNGTTPIYPEVLEAMLPFLTQHFGNPSSGHAYGRAPKQAVDQARRQVLHDCLGAPTSVDPSAIWFTACGTESDNLAIQIALQCTKAKGTEKPHVVTCNVEHPAIEQCLKALVSDGVIDVTYVPVGTDGRVRANDMIAAIQPQRTVLVTLMLANNESGALQPVKEVAEHCRKNNVLVHTDAAQACGKVSVRLEDLGEPDMVTLVGHKIGAPKGIACLYVRPNCYQEEGRTLEPGRGVLLQGGGQEFGRRGGTENVPYIAGFGAACAMAQEHLSANAAHMEAMRRRLLERLTQQLEPAGVELRPNGPEDAALRLPNTLSIGLKDVHSGQLLAEVGQKVAASAGAACHSAAAVSAVLQAMKVPGDFARGTLRLSVGPKTTAEEVDQAVAVIVKAALEQHDTDTI